MPKTCIHLGTQKLQYETWKFLFLKPQFLMHQASRGLAKQAVVREVTAQRFPHSRKWNFHDIATADSHHTNIYVPSECILSKTKASMD